MRVFAIAVLAMILVVPAAGAQTLTFGVQAHLSDCQLHTYVGEIQSVWVAQEGGPAVSAARFKVEIADNGWTSTFVFAWFPVLYVTDPDPFAGGTFSLANCGDLVFVRLDFMSLTSSPECAAEISVVPDPAAASGKIEAFDCDDNLLFAEAGTTVVVNPNPDTCPCVIGPVDTEETTWGRVKALYR